MKLDIHLKDGRVIDYPFYFESKFAAEYCRNNLISRFNRDLDSIEIKPFRR